MKAERRHELKENDLAHMLTMARDYIDRNGGRIGLLILIVLGMAAVVTFALRSRTAAIEDVWRRRSELSFENVEIGKQSLESLKGMTYEISDDRFVLDSLIDYTRQSLRLAQEVPDSPDRELTEMAQAAFHELKQRFPNNPLAVGVALNGLATVEQNMFLIDYSPSHKEKARQYLTKILETKMLNSTPFQRMAVDRLASLDSVFTEVTLEYPPPPEPEERTEDEQDQPEVDQADPLPVDKP